MVNVETSGALEKRIDLAIPMQQIESEVDTRLHKLARTVKLHGFRPGKVPFKIVAQQFGQQIRQEVLGDKIQKSFSDAIKKENLRVAGLPKIEAKAANESAQAFEFSAVFEVYPDVKIGDLSGVKFERPSVTVSSEDVERTIEILRKQRATFNPSEEPVAIGDRVTFDYDANIFGEETATRSAKDTVVVLGEGKTLPGFEPNLVGMKKGDSKDFELVFPADVPDAALANKRAQFHVTIKSVEKAILPEVNEEFAKSLGVDDGSLDTMRKEVKNNLEREVKKRVNAITKENVVQTLLEKTPLQVPKALIEAEQKYMLEQNNQAASADPEVTRTAAQARVGWALILTELVRAQNLQPKPTDVRKLIEEYAEGYERPQEVISWYYADPQHLKEVETLVAENNVVEWALSQGQVIEKTMTFDKLMGTEHGE